jgi:hypothetical protein
MLHRIRPYGAEPKISQIDNYNKRAIFNFFPFPLIFR